MRSRGSIVCGHATNNSAWPCRACQTRGFLSAPRPPRRPLRSPKFAPSATGLVRLAPRACWRGWPHRTSTRPGGGISSQPGPALNQQNEQPPVVRPGGASGTAPLAAGLYAALPSPLLASLASTRGPPSPRRRQRGSQPAQRHAALPPGPPARAVTPTLGPSSTGGQALGVRGAKHRQAGDGDTFGRGSFWNQTASKSSSPRPARNHYYPTPYSAAEGNAPSAAKTTTPSGTPRRDPACKPPPIVLHPISSRALPSEDTKHQGRTARR
jgi:hypothetical protein